MEPVIDRELLRRAHQLEEHALAEIYDRWSPGLYRYSLRLLGDNILAEECVADTFSRFLQILRDGRGPDDFLQAYLYRTAHNWITDHYRRKPTVSIRLEDDLTADSRDGPDQVAAKIMEQQELRAALMALTPDQRQVIVLKYVEGWNNEAIAVAVKKPVGAVKSLQHRALESLRRTLRRQESKKQ